MGPLFYLPSNLIRKNPNSLKEALGYITEITESGQRFLVMTLDGQLITIHWRDIIYTHANRLNNETMNMYMLQIPDWQDTILPKKFNINFDLFLDRFRDFFCQSQDKKSIC